MNISKVVLSTLLVGLLVAPVSTISRADQVENNTLIVVSKQNPADILPAVTLSNYIGSDILIFDKNKTESYNLDKDNKIIVVGGEDSLNNSLFKGVDFMRISGKDRYETSLSVLNYADKYKKVSKVNLISGKSYADGVIVSSSKDLSLLVSDNSKTNERIKSNLDKLGIKDISVIGGEQRVGSNILSYFDAKRISGKDRYDTSMAFTGNVKDGYIESESGSFYKNVLDAKKSIEEGKGFKLIRPNHNKTIIGVKPIPGNVKSEIGEFLINDNKNILDMMNKVDADIKSSNSNIISPISPTNTAYTVSVKNGKDVLYLYGESLNPDQKELHISISKNGSYPKEYVVKDRGLIKNIVDTINSTIFNEYSI